MRYKYIPNMFVVIILSVLVNLAVAEYDCEALLDRPVVNITLNGTDIFVIDSLEINNIQEAYVENSNYVEVEENISDNLLIVKTTEQLAEDNVSTEFTARVVIVCGEDEDEYTLVYNIAFEEPQCERLQFEDTYYSYLFYDILLSTDNFDMDLKRITLECIDDPINLTLEENEYFAIDDSDIDIDGASDTYYINLIVLQDIIAPFDKTLTITAVNKENEDSNATTMFRVEVIESVYTYLEFTESEYVGYIDANYDVVLDNGPIAFVGDVNIDDVNIDISPEFSIFFKINYYSEISLTVSLERNLNELIANLNTINITLMAHNVDSSSSGYATVILDLDILKKAVSNGDNNDNVDNDNNNDNVDYDINDNGNDDDDGDNGDNVDDDDNDDNNDNVDNDGNDDYNDNVDYDNNGNSNDDDGGNGDNVDDDDDNDDNNDNVDNDGNDDNDDNVDYDNNDDNDNNNGDNVDNDDNGDNSDNGDNDKNNDNDNIDWDEDIIFTGDTAEENLGIFSFWVSRSKSMIVIVVVFTLTFVISGIFYLKLKLASRRSEF